MPYYPNAVQRDYIIPAGESCGLGRVGWLTSGSFSGERIGMYQIQFPFPKK